jgi:hypothetical protein
VTTAGGLQAGGSTFAAPNVKASIPTGPITIPNGGKATPDYGPYAAAPSTPDSTASLTDINPSPAPALGLTNIGFAEQQAQQSAGSIAGGASRNIPPTFTTGKLAANVQNGIPAAGAAIAAKTPPSVQAPQISGATVTHNADGSMTYGNALQSADAAPGSATPSSAAPSSTVVQKAIDKAAGGPIQFNFPSQAQMVDNILSTARATPTSAGAVLNSSVPGQFQVGLPTGPVPWSDADRQQANTMLTAGFAAAGIFATGGLGSLGEGSYAIQAITESQNAFTGIRFGQAAATAGTGLSVTMFGSPAGASQLINQIR